MSELCIVVPHYPIIIIPIASQESLISDLSFYFNKA